ncbi:SLATT domain-containing protein [Shewanella oncorhynchi]|uniref:SLATT domain-containing protein n=1 Tax=Shewanella oncorhynchi TaxID=2726434 RepID=UPI003D7B8B0F
MSNNELQMVFTDYSDLSKLMNEWHVRLCNAQQGHYKRSETLYCRANLSGYLLITATTVVTAMLFLDAKDCLKAILVFMSILSAGLSGVVSFARFAENAEKHRSAAGSYGKIRRQLEHLNSKRADMTPVDVQSKLKLLRIEWEYISDNAPPVS